ncbi:MAG: Nicotinate phosphoribosyltransferase pncB1 [Acidimicrobiales bacterium]|nr:MAG: nicotinate phosphoribosyltransferase [Actinomycetota bacterium]MBV6508373.1 Nicotinate phosphoribosyltransferase pncB1 [Acidimicrobiales bacterium]RIK04810.1 MAG: nicotinate phosphoribosyltransferase [Acidobacteriota bacterium]
MDGLQRPGPQISAARTAREPVAPVATALLTDHYELTMLDASLESGLAGRRVLFDVFARGLPSGRRYGVVCGTGRLRQALAGFRFDEGVLGYLDDRALVSPQALGYLANYRFTGDIIGYREGELYFPYSPVLTVEATFGEAVLLETVILSILNHDSAVASAAARMVTAARGRVLVEAGGRRTHEEAAVAAARAAYIAGFDSTSNLEAGRRWGIPTTGTTAHAFMLGHSGEEAAFAAQAGTLGKGTTFLVDTFDSESAIRSAVRVCGSDLGAIRIDSGDLVEEAVRARALLDELGACNAKVIVSGDLDEYAISRLGSSPVDGMLVGTELVSGSGAPTARMVYKLAAVADHSDRGAELRPVAKRSAGKATVGGRKFARRLFDQRGGMVAESLDASPEPHQRARDLQVRIVEQGEWVADDSVEAARRHHALAKAELDPEQLAIREGPPALNAMPAGLDGGGP